MSNHLDSLCSSSSKEDVVDIRKIEWSESEISISAKVKSLVTILINNPKLFLRLVNLKRFCNNSDLVNWDWVYKFYRLKWTNFRPWDITLDSDKELIDFDSKNPEIHKLIFSNPYSVNYLLQQWLENNANNEVRETLHKISWFLVKSINIDIESQENLRNCLIEAKNNQKKVVFLSNHLSHLDAPILDYMLSKLIDLSWKDVRFVCGAYMYYNKWVRPFTVWFNTLFVYWPKDFLRLWSRLPKKSFFELLKRFNDRVINTIHKNLDSEVLVLFPYAWRAKKWEDINYKYGCKDKLPNWMKQMLSLEDCIYIPLWINWTWDMFIGNPSWWGNMIRNFSKISPTDVKLSVWKHFVWWELTMDEINRIMITNSIKVFD